MTEIAATPCPYCGLHAEDYPECWVCDACLETGTVSLEDAAYWIHHRIEKDEEQKAANYLQKMEITKPGYV